MPLPLSNAEIDEKIAQHPCYSAQAHQYARIHLPVAPACNIQCHYCNRKFDCSNESRPGVVSKLLSPAQAINRFTSVMKRMPNLKVVGIAGPGDALANPAQTFSTLNAIKDIAPEMQLCISTNGLELNEHIDALLAANVHHLTITMNTLKPEIGQLLYAWVYHKGVRYKGTEGAELLIEQQLEGLRRATEAGLLVKVNTVLVPGITVDGLPELSKEIKQRGAFLHNLMPLISEPEHGTYFGLNGVRGPVESEVRQAQILSGNTMKQMTHCQQCRADAVGTLDTPSPCSTNNSNRLRIAVASKTGTVIDTHFGHATFFWIFDITSEAIRFIEKREVSVYCQGASECNEDADNLDQIVTTVSDCQQVHCARIGMGPWKTLERQNVQPLTDHAYAEVETALKTLQQVWLEDQQRLKEVS